MTTHQRVAFLIAFVILATGVVGVVGRNLDEDESSALTFPSPTASAPAPTAAPTPTPAPTTAPTAVRTQQPTAAPTPEIVTAPPGGAASMPAEGVYTYRETGEGRFTQSNLRISNTGGGSQREGQDDVVSDVSWRPDGKYTHKVTFGSITCDLEPDLLEIKLPLQQGAVWAIRSSCEIAPGAMLRFSGTSSVLGLERVTIGGTQVDTTRIKSDITVRGEGNGQTVDGKVVTDGLFAPAAGLFVRITTQTSGTDFTGEPSSSSTVLELERLTPRPV